MVQAVLDCAATLIQATYRGHAARRYLSKVWVESLNAASALVSEVTKTRRKVESEEWFSRDQIEMEMTADQEWWAIQAAEAARREMVRPVEEVERLQRQVIIRQQANAVQNIEQIWRSLELESEQCIHRTETINAAEGGWFELQTYQANVRARLALRGDLQSLLDALPIQEADARSQIEGEHQNGLEAVCSWLDSMMDDEDLRVVIHEESAQRTDLRQQAMQRWTSGDLGQTAGALRAMAASEQRLPLVVQEARARSVLHGREADHRTTYTRVWQRWHLECAKVRSLCVQPLPPPCASPRRPHVLPRHATRPCADRDVVLRRVPVARGNARTGSMSRQ